MKIYAHNKKARFDYEMLETYEAGIKLRGHEVKSVKNGQASLRGGFVILRGGEAYLVNTTIPPYQQENIPDSYDQSRPRKLLLQKKELDYLVGKIKQRGLTLVPIKLYNKHGLIKLEFGVARGKKKHDKRETIKKKDIERETGRKFK